MSAAPVIRRMLVEAHHSAVNARTQRDRNAYFAAAFAYAKALEALADHEGVSPAGVAPSPWSWVSGEAEAAQAWTGDNPLIWGEPSAADVGSSS